MEKYALRIDCDVLNEMGLTVSRTLTMVTDFEPITGDAYTFLIGTPPHPITIQIRDIVTMQQRHGNTGLEIYCLGEEIDDSPLVKAIFGWQTFSID
ncbi:MAG TPA: DUF5952 family protein [Chitinophaga sp.]|uniref:DUF5952 family protein n=1 Tax=Chitinophaga sp. TaxID=1869181 RepID=UPI002BCF3E0E|nr:DUF5952 family protein [Chitinophaga sp.]HVI48999.1 DUF5952 family protein [Chitinophaga sp.]